MYSPSGSMNHSLPTRQALGSSTSGRIRCGFSGWVMCWPYRIRYVVSAPERVTSTVYWFEACSVRTRFARSLLGPPRYSTSTPKAFLNASGIWTRAAGLGDEAKTSLPSLLAPSIQLFHCACQSPAGGALPVEAPDEAGAPAWPQAARTGTARAVMRKERRLISRIVGYGTGRG